MNKDEQTYFKGLADHIATKTKELGRISGYQRAGIKYVKVKAILDERTSIICRQMHGRIISVERLAEQKERILQARSIDELKAAQAWIPSFSGKTSELPDGVAGPPYHYRCRTTTVAYFEELEGEPKGDETRQFFDGMKRRKEKVVYRYVDKELGRELVLTDGGVKHVLEKRRHGIKSVDKIKTAMKSIKEMGENIRDKEQIVTLSQNGVVLVFRDNVVYSAYLPESKNYFKNITTRRFKKWVELLKSYFTGLFIR